MLEKAVISFQNHAKRAISFDRITTFVGPTDSGKSAVLRALRWLLLNQPSGADMIGDFGHADYAVVKLLLDGVWAGRLRGGSRNEYRLGNSVYRSFYLGVPKPIQDLAQVDDTSFQLQLDGPFWFDLPPAEVSRKLNSIINLGLIDDTLERAAKQTRSFKAELTVCEKRIGEHQERKDALAWVEELNVKMDSLEKLDQTITQLKQDTAGIASLLSDGERAIVRRQRAARGQTIAAKAISVHRRWSSLSCKRSEIEALLSGANSCRRLLKTPVPAIATLTNLYTKINALQQQKRGIQTILLGASQLIYERETAELQIHAAKQEIKKGTGGRCPTCLRPFNMKRNLDNGKQEEYA